MTKLLTASQMLDRIGRISYDKGNTNTSGGLFKMNREVFVEANGDRPDIDNIAIVLTDGASTRDTNLLIPYASEAKYKGTKILGTVQYCLAFKTNGESQSGIATLSAR